MQLSTKEDLMSNINYDLRKIRGFVFDVDGVLSNESIPLYPNGEPMRIINTKDGYALQLASKCGFQLGIITGGATEAVRIRFENLGFQHIYMGARHKIRNFEDFLHKTQLSPEDICYVGDDIPDYEIMKIVGLPACPADAVPEIKNISKYISHKKGGKGVARDIVEQVLKAQDRWMKEDAFIW